MLDRHSDGLAVLAGLDLAQALDGVCEAVILQCAGAGVGDRVDRGGVELQALDGLERQRRVGDVLVGCAVEAQGARIADLRVAALGDDPAVSVGLAPLGLLRAPRARVLGALVDVARLGAPHGAVHGRSLARGELGVAGVGRSPHT